ncbi:NAD-dependent succinate-semialdehyde dehydrogenase [Streptomyces caniscabiei]|uniref:NAD-dependent succinate-semialdehyde dehydrogenase n=1 Tax=Streptomyces caniscabiei TaxID=2746961 RepID=A0A927KYL7_9ACTN|nr:NAD-dependent succinate-semialdehyde dehydrogenase [Streptomyces caniscabiei]MBD9721671.1 NAD-dependent succinate-semialdehyde dehydrogenase [Streptomyces caniscabiei]MDX3508863.1 NAD-dependent succinate-semialdehyde dehydrogenase [Streptomyces caniscabiei]MDX3717384.1 NAD-dependent succinate-semialdehyde dehydrogenase [Streptomyces caniscabiei]MDX3728005.1 NAD-dependent succinate-semialdehyde dehydrogenase [Streptomyces caniscabiei]WEO23234.1 NAD-dependent succinate-semialdehyde dehydrogen
MTVVRDVPKQLFIGGDWQDAESGRTLSVDNPATGEELCQVADASPADGRRALEAAVAAQAAWAATPPRVRSEILRRAYDIIIARTEDLALLMTLEMGKPLAEARAEVAYGAEFFRWFSEEAVRIDGGMMTAPDGRNRLLVARQPVGPCLLITPWNFPLAMGTRKIGPAVAAGCTIILKPAPQTPLTSLALAEILTEAGLPAGVLNIVTTTDAAGVVEPLLRGGKIRKLSFTGSTQVGRILLAQCADTVIRTSMELGGNAPLIVFEDADLDTAVEGTMVAKMRNMGESCCAANRIFVHTSVADEFAQRLTARMAALTVGPGTEPGIDVGPLIDAAGRSKAHDLVQDAVKRGATVLTGGELPEGPGCFYPPTVLTGIAPDAAIIDSEIFGPVAAIRTFETEDEVVAVANDTEFGLAAYLFTQNLDRALRVAERLESGMIGINTGLVSNPAAPFGGVKQSGLGREGGLVGIDEFLEYKYMAVPVGA